MKHLESRDLHQRWTVSTLFGELQSSRNWSYMTKNYEYFKEVLGPDGDIDHHQNLISSFKGDQLFMPFSRCTWTLQLSVRVCCHVVTDICSSDLTSAQCEADSQEIENKVGRLRQNKLPLPCLLWWENIRFIALLQLLSEFLFVLRQKWSYMASTYSKCSSRLQRQYFLHSSCSSFFRKLQQPYHDCICTFSH